MYYEEARAADPGILACDLLFTVRGTVFYRTFEPVLFNVTAWAALVVPASWFPNAKVPGVTVTAGAVTVIATVAGLELSVPSLRSHQGFPNVAGSIFSRFIEDQWLGFWGPVFRFGLAARIPVVRGVG